MSGAAQLMAGRREGLKRLDLSADGFWNSFSAILVALPPSILSWIEFEAIERPDGGSAGLGIFAAHALADLAAWLFPIAVLVAFAKPAGLSRKIVPLVVALNWGGALIAWCLAPLWLLLLLIGGSDLTTIVGAVAVLASIVLTIRLAATATESDWPIATGIVLVLLVSSFVAYAAVSDLTGVPLA